ncbi:MAG: glutathione S-transferase family protein [Alphaproteobacteria bacterium]
MITLFVGGPGFGLPEVSPYATKMEVQLQMAGLAYRKEHARPPEGPKGQLPFIEDDGVRIGDTTFIRGFLEQKYGFDLDDGLTPVERAQAWAFERMIENQFGWTIAYMRWLMPENFAKGPAHFFDGMPEHFREERLACVRETIKSVGVGRHAHDEITALGERSLLALSEQLGRQTYLFGARPVGVDATAFALLASLYTPFFDSPLRQRAMSYANLRAYADRMMALHFPTHDWIPLARAKHVEDVG